MELYRTKSHYGRCCKSLIFIVALVMVIVAIWLMSTGHAWIGGVVLAVLVVDLFIYWCVFPKRIAVHEDAIRIQSCCGIAIPFSEIRSVEKDTHDFDESSCLCNCATAFKKKRRVYVRRHKGANYVMTPKDLDNFVAAAQAQLSVVHNDEDGMSEQPGAYEDETGGTGGTQA